jgi:hypothetical protein
VQPVLLTPGAAVRLPVGYVWVLVVGVLVLTVGGYLLGRSRGIELGRSESTRTRAAQEEAARETARLREPVATSTPTGSGDRSRPPVAGDRPPMGRPPVGGGARVDAGGRPSDVLAERRESGKWYYQIITTKYDNAVETARIVSAQGAGLGLDAQVVPGEDGQFATVILLPGFDNESLTQEDRMRWRETIRELGSLVAGKVTLSSTAERPFADAFARRHP